MALEESEEPVAVYSDPARSVEESELSALGREGSIQVVSALARSPERCPFSDEVQGGAPGVMRKRLEGWARARAFTGWRDAPSCLRRVARYEVHESHGMAFR